MSSNLNDYVRPTDKSSRRDINKILSLIHDLVAQEPESEGLQQRICFTPHVTRKSNTVTFGTTTVANTDDREIENFMFRKKIPLEVITYDIIHTTTGTLTFSTSGTKFGGGATFDGSSYVTITDHPELAPTSISFGGWFYLPATASSDTAYQSLISKGVYELSIDPHATAANQLRAKVNLSGDSDLLLETGATLQTEDSQTIVGDATRDEDVTYAFNADAWNHIWVTFGSAGLKLYLNNSLVATNVSVGDMQTNTDNLVIG
ncbi:LamG domain-containing protein [Planctomycetota bacterium]|nr:LamG domain-containing protein [Planctomycetota bacterium]